MFEVPNDLLSIRTKFISSSIISITQIKYPCHCHDHNVHSIVKRNFFFNLIIYTISFMK